MQQQSNQYHARADEAPNLGSCCICERSGPTVRNMVMLPKRAPIAGRGWGCMECHLPLDGVVAVVCDSCLGPLNTYGQPIEVESRLRFACRGYPGSDGRIPIGDLDPAPFDHDPAFHRDELDARVEAWIDEDDENEN